MDPVSLTLLALALSLDSLSVGLLYGLRGIKLPWQAVGIVSLATGVLLSLAMAGGRLTAVWLPPHLGRRLGALLLIGVGIWITIQTWRSRSASPAQELPPATPEAATDPAAPEPHRVWHLRLGSMGIVIQILREPGAADLDHSGHINPMEAVLLGVALAMDSVAAGLGAALAGFSLYGLPLAAAAGSFLLMLVGSRAGGWLPFRPEGRWAAIHGLVLVGLGLYRMVA